MGVTLDEIYAEALTLPEETRMELVARLLGSMPADAELERKQSAESHRGVQEVESAEAPVISAEEVFRQIRDSLAAHGAVRASQG